MHRKQEVEGNMIETIMIDGKPIEIDSASGWTYCYREQFGHDILPDMLPIMRSIATAAAGLLSELPDESIEKELFSAKELKSVLNSDNAYVIQDAIDDLAGLEVTTVQNIFWALAKNANFGIAEPRRFYNTFDVFPYEEVLPKVIAAIIKSSSSSKNSKSLLAKMKLENPSD